MPVVFMRSILEGPCFEAPGVSLIGRAVYWETCLPHTLLPPGTKYNAQKCAYKSATLVTRVVNR
jgi:hypothetical protein